MGTGIAAIISPAAIAGNHDFGNDPLEESATLTHALGISVHTGWAACVVVSGSAAKPLIVANREIEILDDAERFCFPMAAEMERAEVEPWIARLRKQALANAKREFASLLTGWVRACAIVAKTGEPGDLDAVLASHPRLHTAEGCFYRDVLRDACSTRVQIVPPSSLDPSRVGKLAPPPWGKDQKLAALAAWKVLDGSGC